MFIVVGLLYIIHMTSFPSQEMRSTTVQPGGNWLSQCQKIPSFLHQHICLFLSLEPTFKSTYTVFQCLSLARNTGKPEGDAAAHLWGRLGVLLQRGNAALLGNRVPAPPDAAIDGII